MAAIKCPGEEIYTLALYIVLWVTDLTFGSICFILYIDMLRCTCQETQPGFRYARSRIHTHARKTFQQGKNYSTDLTSHHHITRLWRGTNPCSSDSPPHYDLSCLSPPSTTIPPS